MKTVIILAGVYNLFLAFFHILFWKVFRWKKDLKKLSYENKAIIQILNIQIIYLFLMVAATCFIFPEELVETKLGNFFLLLNSCFWLVRVIQQFIFLRINHYFVHFLTLLFIIGTIIFILPLLKYL